MRRPVRCGWSMMNSVLIYIFEGQEGKVARPPPSFPLTHLGTSVRGVGGLFVLHLPAMNIWRLTLAGCCASSAKCYSVGLPAWHRRQFTAMPATTLRWLAVMKGGWDTCDSPWHHSSDMFQVTSLPVTGEARETCDEGGQLSPSLQAHCGRECDGKLVATPSFTLSQHEMARNGLLRG